MSGFGRGLFLKKDPPPTPQETPKTTPVPPSTPSQPPVQHPGSGDAFLGRGQGTSGRGLPPTSPGRGLPFAIPGRGFPPAVEPSVPAPVGPGRGVFGRGALFSAAQPEAAPLVGGRGAVFQSMFQVKSPPGPPALPTGTPREVCCEGEEKKSKSSSSSDENLSALMAQADLDEELPAVMMTGKAGTPFTVFTNYIRLETDPGKGVFQYDVKFEPAVDSRMARLYLMKQISHLIGDTKSFDGAILYLPVLLKDKVTVAKALLSRENIEVEITITHTKTLKLGHPHAIHLYNVLFRRIMNILGLAEHGRHFYDPNGVHNIPEFKLEVWPGFVTSIQEFEGGVMLCCDASHRVLRTQTVLQLMENMGSTLHGNWQEAFVQMISGQRVLTKYNNKSYRVDDVDFKNTPKSTFPLRNGTQISYVDYYMQNYDVKIADKGQPLLKSKVKKTIRGKEESFLVDLIPELCYMTGITDDMRQDFKVMKSIAQTTQASPQQRVLSLRKFLKNINTNKDAKALLDNWGLTLAEMSEPLKGRVLNPEEIYFGGGNSFPGSYQVDWTKGASNNPVLDAVELSEWFIICTQRDEKIVIDFVQMVSQVARKLGMDVSKPNVITISNDNTSNYIQAMKKIKGQAVRMIVIILPIARADKYTAVKRFCCHEFPVPSQVILTKTIRNPDKLRSVTIKIVLQMNCKLGGTLWTVKMPLKNTMIVGMDAFHKMNQPSVGAIVCSMNAPATRWYSRVYKSGPATELQDGLDAEFLQCLRTYEQVNGALPEQIVLYRDGVSDGQLKMVIDYEIPQMIEACRRSIVHYTPNFLVVIVKKNISTRYYAVDSKGYQNPQPGSVLDHTVTRRDQFDFFLVSQNARVGTVSPTHYVVAENTTAMDADKIQRLTYKMTHLYYNWCGTVRVPAPCQYAHKLAYLVGEHLGREGDASLNDKLYYL